ncbi:FAD-dependent monooxygenase, partial [Escherichia coli]|uniref:FAD-dependent monooxygenase n=1 Tax=Escherichia coli TaxID=562 RepID=UPI001CBE0B26
LHLHFDARDADTGPLGYMFENRVLRVALIEAAAKAPNLSLYAPARYVSVDRTATGVRVALDDGTLLAAPLVVAADGRRSALREAAGIRVGQWRYP